MGLGWTQNIGVPRLVLSWPVEVFRVKESSPWMSFRAERGAQLKLSPDRAGYTYCYCMLIQYSWVLSRGLFSDRSRSMSMQPRQDIYKVFDPLGDVKLVVLANVKAEQFSI